MLSPAFRRSHFRRQVPVRPQRRKTITYSYLLYYCRRYAIYKISYKKLKIKVLNYNADILFNKQCLSKKFIPNYANIKVPVTSPAAQKTKKNKIQTTRLKYEIRFLYKKNSGVPRNFFSGGVQQIQLRTERTGIWGRSPLFRGSGGGCNLVQ